MNRREFLKIATTAGAALTLAEIGWILSNLSEDEKAYLEYTDTPIITTEIAATLDFIPDDVFEVEPGKPPLIFPEDETFNRGYLQREARIFQLENKDVNSPDERTWEFIRTHEILEGDPAKPQVMLTYDDFPWSFNQFQTLLANLKSEGGKATFFFLGRHLSQLEYYGWDIDDTKRTFDQMLQDGHELACHGWQHDDPMVRLTDQNLSFQLEQSLDAMHALAPSAQIKFFRAPYGARDGFVLDVAARFGLQHVLWNTGSNGTDPDTLRIALENIVSVGGNGALVLSHMQRRYDVKYAADIVRILRDEFGLSSCTVSNGIKPSDRRELA